MTILLPHPALAGVVDHYGLGCHGTDAEGFRFEYYPDGCADLLFEYTPQRCKLLLFGPARQKATIVLHADCHYFSVRFKPGRFPREGALDPSGLVDRCEALDRLFGFGVDQLGELLAEARTAASRKAIIDQVLLTSAKATESPHTTADKVIAGIDASRGMLPMGELARELNVSLRQIQRCTLDRVGLTPKTLARNLRLQWVLKALDAKPSGHLTTLAHETGYHDQPHFIRDFKALTGFTPITMLRQRRVGFRMIRLAGSSRINASASILHVM